MDYLLSIHYPYIITAIVSGIIDQPLHQYLMGFQKMVLIGGYPLFKLFIGCDGITCLLYLAGWGDYLLSFQNSGDLCFAERIALNGERALNLNSSVKKRSTIASH